jgi:hypothetical protein
MLVREARGECAVAKWSDGDLQLEGYSQWYRGGCEAWRHQMRPPADGSRGGHGRHCRLRRGAGRCGGCVPGERNGNLANLSAPTFVMLRAFASTSLHARELVCPRVLYQTLIYFLFYIIFPFPSLDLEFRFDS